MTHLALVGTGGLFAVLLLTRLVGLDSSFSFDEVFTVVKYVDRGPLGIWFGPYEPNDHVLFNLVTWLTTSVVGQSEALYRLWSVVPALLAAGILTWWTWHRLGRGAAVATLFLVTTAPLFLQLHKEARGYGLTALAAVLMIVASDRLLQGDATRGRWVAFGAAGALGIWTHIAFLVGYVAQSLVLIPLRKLRVACLVTGVCVALASLAFYGPLVGQMAGDLTKYYGDAGPSNSESLYVAAAQGAFGIASKADPAETAGRPPLVWHATLTGPLSLMAPGAEVFLNGTYPDSCSARCYTGERLVLVGLVAVFWLAGALALWLTARRRLLLLLAGPPAITFFLLTLPQGFVATRFVSYTLPYAIVLTAVGIAAVATWLARAARPARPLVAVVVSIGAVLCLVQFTNLASRWIALPVENTKVVAEVVEGASAQQVVSNSTRPLPFTYYLSEKRLRARQPAELEPMFCSAAGPYVFVFSPLRADPVDMSCLARRGAPRVRVDQRGRGGYVDIYFVEGPPPEGAPRASR